MRWLLAYGPAALAWVAVLYRLPALRRSPRDPAIRAHLLTLLSLTVALTILLPPIYVAIDRLAGFPNLARLLGNSLVLVAGWAVQAFLYYLSYPAAQARRATHRNGYLLLGTLVTAAVLFVLAPVDDEALEFDSLYADAPFVLEYRLVYLGYLGLALGNVVRLSWRYARLAARPPLHLGLRLVAAGWLLGLGYVGHEGLRVVAGRLGLPYPVADPEVLTEVLVAGVIGLVIIGTTMPAWGPRAGIPALYRWAVHYRACRRLYPLWRTLCRAVPEIALIPPRSALGDALAVRDVGLRLYRRVVEIRDGRLALRPYFDQRAADYARALCEEACLPAEEATAVVEAATLAAALRARALGRTGNPPASLAPPPCGADLASELRFLERVVGCYQRSPIVRAVLAQVERDITRTSPSTQGAG
jgi:hypothetical protein